MGTQHIDYISECGVNAERTPEECLWGGSWIRNLVVAGIHVRHLTAHPGHGGDSLARLHAQGSPHGYGIESRSHAVHRHRASGRLRQSLAGLWDNDGRDSG
jgi:hypothetical protein